MPKRKVIGFYTDRQTGKVRPVTKRSSRSLAAPTVFFPAKSKKYSEMVRIDTPKAAEDSVEKLMKEFNEAKTREKKVRIKRYTVLAENRARIMAGNERLSTEERQEAAKVAEIYARAKEKMVI